MRPRPGHLARCGRTRATRIVPALLVVGAGLAAYANAMHGPFVFDDLQPKGALDLAPEQLRPIHWLSFALNRAISGQETWSYHAFNLLVHVACGLALLALLTLALRLHPAGLARVTRRRIALTTTLLWTVHPLQTETVTYISQRTESLASLFYLLFLYSFLRSSVTRRPRGWQVLALASFALGMASKEIVATAPILAWVFQWTILARAPGFTRRNARMHAAIAGAWLVLVAIFVVPPLATKDTSAGFGLREITPVSYLVSQPGVLLHYLRLVFWPHPLCLDYGWPVARETAQIVPHGLAIVALLTWTVARLVARSWTGLVGAWFFVLLAPTSSFVPIKDLAFEHRMYLPLAGVLFLVVVAARALGTRLDLPRAVLPTATVALLALLAGTTLRRNQDYSSALTLWRVTSKAAPANARPHTNLAAALLQADRIDEAITELELAISLDATDHVAHLNLGSARLRLGQVERALPLFERAVELRTGMKEEWSCRDALGRALFARGDYAGASAEIGRAQALNPRDANVLLGLANALFRANRTAEAIARYREALQLDPGLQEAHVNLVPLLLADSPSQALMHAQAALAIAPDTLEERFNLGLALRAVKRFDESISVFRECIATAPERPEPYAAFARTVGLWRDAAPDVLEEALRHAREANRLSASRRPDFLEIQAQAEAAMGHFARATELVEQALALPRPAGNEVFETRLRALRDEYRRLTPR